MSDTLEATLAGATQSALETTAFLFAESSPPPPAEAPAPPSLFATVTFAGAHEGALSIEFPARLLPVLAMNVLGEEEAPGDDMQRDALGELANIVCGNVLPSLDPTGKYSLGPPVVMAERAAVVAEAIRVARGDVWVEGERVATSLWLCPPGSTAARA